MSAFHSVRTSINRALRLSAAAVIAVAAVLCGAAGSAGAASTRLVEPSTTGAGIIAEPTADRYHVVVEPDGARGRPLVVVLGGTGSRPAQYDDFTAHAASLGFPAINLRYLNAFTVASVCVNSLDPDCFTQIRGEIVFGDGVPDPNGDSYSSAGANVDAANSIVGRLIALIDHLAADDPHWDRFLIDDPASLYVATHRGPVRLDHKKLILTGHSQGGGHAALWAMRAAVERVVMLASPDDTSSVFGTASWVLGESQTPLDRYWGIRHMNEGPLGQNVPTVWNKLGGGGVGAGDNTSEVGVGDGSGDPNGSHRLVITIEQGSFSNNHSSMAVDGRYLAGVPQAWTYVLTSCPSRRGGCPRGGD